ncbi:MAG TPA: hypothetical protein VMV71_01330 [Candidatus Paceibacterota bacterium]|nr:hypothetical protein [Candidatus Paceibacterota bacterium]
MKMIFVFAVLLAGLITAGCGTISVNGKPVIGFSSETDKNGKPVPAFGTEITVYQYGVGGQVQSPPTPPGTPPTPPLQPSGNAITPPAVTYATVYDTVDDPTLRAFVNQSANSVRLQIDGNPEEIRLAPYQSTADISFKPGEHRVKVTIERPTENFGTLETSRFIDISVRPNDHWQAIYVGW